MRIDLDETQRTGEPVAEQHQPTETEVEPEAKRTKRKTSTKRGWKSKKSVVKSKHKSKTKTEVKLRPDGLRQGSVGGCASRWRDRAQAATHAAGLPQHSA
jgi:hypothetical protein